MSIDRDEQLWKGLGVGAGLLAGLVARKAMERLWTAARGTHPPANPASPSTTWAEALIWAASSGVTLAVTRLIAQRGAAEAWRVVTGDYPEGLEEVRP